MYIVQTPNNTTWFPTNIYYTFPMPAINNKLTAITPPSHLIPIKIEYIYRPPPIESLHCFVHKRPLYISSNMHTYFLYKPHLLIQVSTVSDDEYVAARRAAPMPAPSSVGFRTTKGAHSSPRISATASFKYSLKIR